MVLGLDELAGVGVGQDEASSHAHVENHDKQNIEISVIALGTGHLAQPKKVSGTTSIPLFGPRPAPRPLALPWWCSSSSRQLRRVRSLWLSLQFMAVGESKGNSAPRPY